MAQGTSLNRLKHLLRQSAIRQVLLLLTVFAVISSLVWAATYVLLTREITRLVDARLDTQVSAAVTALEHDQPLPAPGFGQTLAFVMDGMVVQGQLPQVIEGDDRPDGFYEYRSGTPREPDYRFMVYSMPRGQVIATENVERQDEVNELLVEGPFVALVTSLLATLFTGFWIARRDQARLDAISDGLACVARGDLSARIHLPDKRDDLSLLASRIDATTERLEQSVERIRVQSANIAHDLRTPLARLRAHVETSYSNLQDKSAPVTAEGLEAALAQIDSIVGTFDALLRIARIESGARKEGFALVDLGVLARTIEEVFAPVVEDAGQTLRVDVTDSAEIMGDQDLLVQLFANLLQNAMRYGSEGQVITLFVHAHQVSLTDQGPGIPFAERDKVFEPLYQLDRNRQSAGFGLGLALVRAVSDLHSAQLTLSDGADQIGLTVTVRFPKLTKL